MSLQSKRINKSAMPQTDDPWGRQLLDSMILLIKEELHHFWQVREMMLARDIPYVKITASNYARYSACGAKCAHMSR